MPLRIVRIFRRRTGRSHQRVLTFLERQLRLERQFKLTILIATGLIIIAIMRAFPLGYHLSRAIDGWSGRTLRQSLHLYRSREEINASWHRLRASGIIHTRERVADFFQKNDEATRKLLRYAAMDPDHCVLGWGNYDWILMLSSKVFEPDGRQSYRFRPKVKSIWLRNVGMNLGGSAFFLVPDTPDLDDAIAGTTAKILETSRQTTNSWGLRGPEPDPDAALRVMVLGDSYMQGMFIGDDETPPVQLQRVLTRELGVRVSVLNAGVMGYGPEQYYYSMMDYEARFRPHFVVVSVFANDCGSTLDAVGRGVGDWTEGRYWIEKIADDCNAKRRGCLVVPAPFRSDVLERRKPGFYPGAWANVLTINSSNYLDPMDAFVNAHLKARAESRLRGEHPQGCTLFNDPIDDDHFSPAGALVWAESVGRRVMLLLEDGEETVASGLSRRGESL